MPSKKKRTEPVEQRFPALEEMDVVLKHFAPDAQQVQLAGTFNGWRPEANPLVKGSDGDWTARLKLKAGRYEYRFVVDGIWTSDPRCPASVPNPHGGTNSLLKVGLDDRAEYL